MNETCSCIKVALDGDDALGATSGAVLPFANVQPALDYAATHPEAPRSVCVAEGATCGGQATYAGPAGADLSMRNGVSLYGRYESSGWSRCAQGGTTLAPTTGAGVYFGPAVQSATILDGFAIARYPAETTAAVTLDGAVSAQVVSVDVGMPAPGATTAIGVDARNGAEATLTGLSASVAGGTPWCPPNLVGIRGVDSKLSIDGGNFRLFSSTIPVACQSVTGLSLDNASGSSVVGTTFTFLSDTTTTPLRIHDSADVTLDGVLLDHTAGTGFGTSPVAAGADLTRTAGISWTGGTLRIASGVGIVLTDSPGAKLDVAVTASTGTGITLSGDASGTVLDGSVTVTGSSTEGLSGDGCNGTAPVINTTVTTRATQSGGAGIAIGGDCKPTISSTVSVALGASMGTQNLAAIRCTAPSRCTIDHANASVVAGLTTSGSVWINSYGIQCDPGSCPVITHSHASALSAVGEHRISQYQGGGVTAPGSTLVSGNVIEGACTAGNGFGIEASGRIENNVITGPTCGASNGDQGGSHVVGLVTDSGDVHSNDISGGGPSDCDPLICTGYLGCVGVGVKTNGGQIRNNKISSGCVGPALSMPSSSNALAGPVEHNLVAGTPLLAPSSPAVTTIAQLNALVGATGNFSSGSGIDAGTPTGAPAVDIDDNPRDQYPDVGPYEQIGAPSACYGVGCSNHGVCLTGACACDPGYTGQACEFVDQCQSNNGGCDALTTCTPNGASVICGPCPPGYSGDGVTGCSDIDECATDNGGCDELTSCTNVDGGRSCGDCPLGYTGNGETGCVLSDLCGLQPCEHGGTCTEQSSSYTCTCPVGNPGANCEHYITQLALGDAHACALLDDATLTCWGSNTFGQTNAPSGTFLDVASGKDYSCAVATDHSLHCWGNLTAPSGSFTSVASGNVHACAIRDDGTVACFGNAFFGKTTPPSDTFTALSAGFNKTCGLKSDQTLACWGDNSFGGATPPTGTFTSLGVGNYHGCAILPDQTVTCWGYNVYGQATAPSGTFTSLALAGDTSCGIRTDQTVACWGYYATSYLLPPAGTFVTLDANRATDIGRVCGVDTDELLQCWGDL